MIYVFPGDHTGCGQFRLAWPAEQLRKQGHTIRVLFPEQRGNLISAGLNVDGDVLEAYCPDDAETLVFQRVTSRKLVQSIPLWQERGIRIVIDIDDDLSCIHPTNPAFASYKPGKDAAGNENINSWLNLVEAARIADVVTVTTRALAQRFRPQGDAVILENYLPDHYYGLPREDKVDLCWPAGFGTHPNDSEPVLGTLQTIARETGAPVRMIGSEAGQAAFRAAFGIDPIRHDYVSMREWPAFLATIGVSFVPLADTEFNRSKSWLKPLELSACGVPWVASPRADYLNLAHYMPGVGAFADSRKEWRRQLKRLLCDADLRAEQSKLGREAAERFRIRDHAWKWAAPWGLA